MQETLKDAQKINPAITLQDVRLWKEKFIPRKAPMRGYNSYVAPGPLHNIQVDMFWYKFEEPEAPKVKGQTGQIYTANIEQYGVLAVDSFTKYAHVVPLGRKTEGKWKKALQVIVAKMGKPKQIYSDPDASLNSRDVQE